MSHNVADNNQMPSQVAVVQKSQESVSTDEGIRKEESRLSQEFTKQPTNLSTSSDDSKVFKKSFGIRKQEIQLDCINTWWLKSIHFFTAFIGMYISLMETAATNVFVGFATNDYKQHSLMTTIGVIRGVVIAACVPPFARLSDIFGRFEIFWVGMVLRVMGLIIMSQATDVQKYAGGIVFYGAGFAANRVLFQISTQDATTLKWRLFSNAVIALPVIITTWSSGDVVALLQTRYGWKFGIAMWAWTVPLCCVPFGLSCLYFRFQAMKTPEWKKVCQEERESQVELIEAREEYRLSLQSANTWTAKTAAHLKMLFHYTKFRVVETFWAVDLLGCLCVVCIFGFILVPLTLAGGSLTKWRNGGIIAPLVIGFCFIPIFVIWEMKFSRTPLIPVPLLRDRGIWSGFAIGIFSTFASGIPGAYAFAVLHVGMNATKVVATRTPQLGSFVTCVALPFVALAVTRIRRTKALILFGCGVLFIAMGLFVHFRGDNDGIRAKYYRDGLAIAFSIDGFGNAFFMRPVGVSMQACTNYEYMATITALFAALYNIGGACARCVSGAIWTQKMYPLIVKKMELLGVNTSLAKPAYQSPYTFAAKYAWGTPPRRAVALAYAELQRQLCIVALCLLVPLLVFCFFLRDHRLQDVRSLEDVEDFEKGAHAGERSKGAVIYTDDDDKILKFLRIKRRGREN